MEAPPQSLHPLLDIDVCDWLFHHDRDNHDAPLGDAVYVKKQKNDQRRQGMVKRFAFGSAENTCLPRRMRAFMMMIVLLLFLQKQNLAYAVYQFGSVLSLPD
jgi:hypothetical protein